MRIYSLNELKNISNDLTTIEFFNLPSKLSKANYEKHFKLKYDEFFIKDLSISQMRRYYNDEVYKFYIDNFDEIEKDNNIFFNYINSLSTNIKKSLTRNTIKSTYPIVYDNFIEMLENKKEIKFENNEKYYMDGIIKGSTFKNKDIIEKKIVNYLGGDAINDYADGCKVSYIIKKYFYKENIKYRCSTCNKPTDSHIERFKECLDCYLKLKQDRENEKRKNYILQNIPNHITFIEGNFYTTNFYEEQYKIYCDNCKKEYNYEFKSYKRVFRCPKCDSNQKINHSINSIFDNIFRVNSKKFIKPKEIDLINHEHKICIEYNGIMFHSHGISEHSKFNNPDIDKTYHLLKTEEVENKGYQLFHIFENEWINARKNKIWISMINNKLGKSEKIYARKCILKTVSTTEEKDFLENNHLQGNCASAVKLGLFYNDELVSIMTFRRHKKYQWEIARFANKINTTVVGSASKLLKYFEKNYNPDMLLSYANRRWSQGKLYERLGFLFDGNTKPNYFYFNANEKILYPREKFQKHKLKNILEKYDENLSELINMYNNNYRIIFDCGSKRYVKFYERN